MRTVLEVDAIHTYYGSSRALFGVSLAVQRGECVCLLGRNGVGKTTMMRSIMGLTPPAQGQVLWKGRRSPAGGPTASPAPASASCPRTGACSPS